VCIFWKSSRFATPFGVFKCFLADRNILVFPSSPLRILEEHSAQPGTEVSAFLALPTPKSRWERIIPRLACVWRSKPKSGRKNIALCYIPICASKSDTCGCKLNRWRYQHRMHRNRNRKQYILWERRLANIDFGQWRFERHQAPWGRRREHQISAGP
jgi:hypothetical protein